MALSFGHSNVLLLDWSMGTIRKKPYVHDEQNVHLSFVGRRLDGFF